jgi:hypothetical protein
MICFRHKGFIPPLHWSGRRSLRLRLPSNGPSISTCFVCQWLSARRDACEVGTDASVICHNATATDWLTPWITPFRAIASSDRSTQLITTLSIKSKIKHYSDSHWSTSHLTSSLILSPSSSLFIRFSDFMYVKGTSYGNSALCNSHFTQYCLSQTSLRVRHTSSRQPCRRKFLFVQQDGRCGNFGWHRMLKI